MQQPFLIAIDGPAGAGKTTIGQMIAEIFEFVFFDTGVMYRCAALAVLNRDIEIGDAAGVVAAVSEAKIDVIPASTYGEHASSVLLNGIAVTHSIYEKAVEKVVAPIASIPEVRRILVDRQRRMMLGKQAVIVGRDIGTVVFPKAHVKLYLYASLEERARRRTIQQGLPNTQSTLRQCCEELSRRDGLDTERTDSPLRVAFDAIKLDSTGISPDSVIASIVPSIRSAFHDVQSRSLLS